MVVQTRDLPDSKEINLNRSQALIQIINANVCYCPWPRASGKTSGGIGPRVLNLSEKMPRSQCLLVADTFERISKVLWPSIENFLNEELGLVPDVDYVVHKRPPEHFARPYFIPAKFDHVISFSSGFCLCEVSLDVSGSGNGYNAQALIADEVKYFDEKKFKSEVRPAIRGGKKLWGHLPEFRSMWFFSDKFPSKGADITWVLDKKAEVNDEAVQIIYALQVEQYKLQQQINNTQNEQEHEALQKKIDHYEKVMNEKRMNLLYYSDALPYENIDELGPEYYRDLRRDLTPYEYRIAIENEDPNKAMYPFYADLCNDHFYKSNVLFNPNRGLIIALDYQWKIAPLLVAQLDQLPDSAYTTLNFVQALHALHPKGIADVLRGFCERFKDHPDRHVTYIYNQTAIGRSPHGKTFMDLVQDNIIINGWTFTDIYTGDPPDHDIKEQRLKYWLHCRTDSAIRINQLNNSDLKISLEKTSAITVNGKTRKDKTSERDSSPVPPQHATHYTDVFDDIWWAVNEMQLVSASGFTGIDITSGSK